MGSTNDGVGLSTGAIVVSEAVTGYDMDYKDHEDANGLTRLPADADERAAAFLASDWSSAVG